MLLGREEVDSNKSDNNGRTPLSHAAACRRGGVVGILLGQGEVSVENGLDCSPLLLQLLQCSQPPTE